MILIHNIKILLYIKMLIYKKVNIKNRYTKKLICTLYIK